MDELEVGRALVAPSTGAVFRELRDGVGALLSALEEPLLRDEVLLFRRLLYKNKNQHRTTLHYRRLAEASRHLAKVVHDGDDARPPPPLQSALRQVSAVLAESFPAEAAAPPPQLGGRPMPVSVRLPCRAEGQRLLSLLQAAEPLSETVCASLLRAYGMMRLLLSQTNFMPFCTAMLALTARLHTLLQALPAKRTRCAECLASCEAHLPAAAGGASEGDGDSASEASAEDEEEQERREGDAAGRDAGALAEPPAADESEDDDDDMDDIFGASSAEEDASEEEDDAEEDGSDTDDSESESGSGGGAEQPGVRVLASVPIGHGARLCVSAGSVLDFGQGSGWDRRRVAVVNAANTGGLGGGGVDGAFVARGGAALAQDRLALPVLPSGGRIRTGDAVATTCRAELGGYGDLFAHTVIHAVGPAYGYDEGSFAADDAALRGAYEAAMECASGARGGGTMSHVGFSLLSSGIFRVRQPSPADRVLAPGLG